MELPITEIVVSLVCLTSHFNLVSISTTKKSQLKIAFLKYLYTYNCLSIVFRLMENNFFVNGICATKTHIVVKRTNAAQNHKLFHSFYITCKYNKY